MYILEETNRWLHNESSFLADHPSPFSLLLDFVAPTAGGGVSPQFFRAPPLSQNPSKVFPVFALFFSILPFAEFFHITCHLGNSTHNHRASDWMVSLVPPLEEVTLLAYDVGLGAQLAFMRKFWHYDQIF